MVLCNCSIVTLINELRVRDSTWLMPGQVQSPTVTETHILVPNFHFHPSDRTVSCPQQLLIYRFQPRQSACWSICPSTCKLSWSLCPAQGAVTLGEKGTGQDFVQHHSGYLDRQITIWLITISHHLLQALSTCQPCHTHGTLTFLLSLHREQATN